VAASGLEPLTYGL